MRILMHDNVLLTTFDTGMPALKLRFMDRLSQQGCAIWVAGEHAIRQRHYKCFIH